MYDTPEEDLARRIREGLHLAAGTLDGRDDGISGGNGGGVDGRIEGEVGGGIDGRAPGEGRGKGTGKGPGKGPGNGSGKGPDAAWAWTPHGDFFAQVRSGVRKRRNARLSVAVAVVLVVGVGVSFAAQNRTGSTVAGPYGGTSATANPNRQPGTCPSSPYSLAIAPPVRPGADHVFVPGSPISALACVYHVSTPSPGTTPTTTLQSSHLSTGQVLNAAVAILGKPPAHPGSMRCPSQNPSLFVDIYFRYASGPDVEVGYTPGCLDFSNGSVSGQVDPNFTVPPAIAALSG